MMLSPHLRRKQSSWGDLLETTKTDLTSVLRERQTLSARISKNCEIVTGYAASLSAEDICSQYLSYLSEKYAFRKLLLERDSRCLDLASRRVRLLDNSSDDAELERRGHLILLFHFGRYLEAMLLVLKQAKTSVIWAGRRQSDDETYQSFLSFVKDDLTSEWQNTFADILTSLCAGKTVLLAPDSANFHIDERNKPYKIGNMRVLFDEATDIFIERSNCKVSCLFFEGVGSEVETAMLRRVNLKSKSEGLQEALDECMAEQLIRYPWKWDRLKYLHLILSKDSEGGS